MWIVLLRVVDALLVVNHVQRVLFQLGILKGELALVWVEVQVLVEVSFLGVAVLLVVLWVDCVLYLDLLDLKIFVDLMVFHVSQLLVCQFEQVGCVLLVIHYGDALVSPNG